MVSGLATRLLDGGLTPHAPRILAATIWWPGIPISCMAQIARYMVYGRMQEWGLR